MAKYRLPIAIVGKEHVGKTSICLRFCKDTFSDDYRSTLGSQIFEKQMMVDDTIYDLVIWDLGGQDQFNNECSIYIKQAYVVILAFSVDDLDSFVQLKKWKEFIHECADNDPDVFLVSTKIDLRNGSGTCVTTGQVQSMVDKMGFSGVVETSAKTGYNISRVFKKTAEICHSRGRNAYSPISMKEIL